MVYEINQIIIQLQDLYEGDPWYGRPIKQLLEEVEEEKVFIRPNNQHSLVELLWHIITWRQFTISRFFPEEEKELQLFEELDWRAIDKEDKTLWKKGLQELEETQKNLLKILKNLKKSCLDDKVPERNYDYRKLLYGIIQHDIYHLGQIAYLIKLLKD